ncbi:sulfatase-like hydrolase/transferase [Paludisphaera rhizosphaerae]|uniref:sulfatase-like hydrolase/transferase n=1 Tax=Paludisphaera rhizosphaerae TaxID=2711216 RepID=UPI0013EC3CC0|nr:sulfatase-like hydrolase/transferase [Paludisphaera rhizosphaerae]
MMRLAILAALAFAALTGVATAAETKRPDVVVIVVDDLRWDELGAVGHPFAKTPNIDRVAAEGALFRNAFATTPLCSPSRASIMTGKYPHAHGIVDNTERSPLSHRLTTFPKLLHDAGYATGFVGKWHMGNDPSRRPGFDSWVCLKGQGTSFDPEMDVDGRTIQEKGYVTDVLDGYVQKFLKKASAEPSPFLLYVAEKGLHPETAQAADGTLSDPNASTYIPADRHKTLYADAAVPRRPNVKDPLVGKPALKRPIPGLPPLSEATGTTDEAIRDRQRMLASIDESVGRMLETLRAAGRLDGTVFIVTSDHGYFYGEHGLSVERRLAYEEAIRIPLFLRFPSLVKPGTTIDRTVLTIDLAPTLLDLAGAASPADVQGVSFAPVLRGQAMPPRDAFLIEHSSDKVFPRAAGLGYKAVRTDRWKYIHYLDVPDADELYDLAADPYELTNRIGDPSVQGGLAELRRKLEALSR